jgi:2-oxoisovalerate dehydrogenase E2 component (dihydrolipoyl transacylase)
MATTITMPQLGETVTEGTIAQWLKKVGDSVEKYEAFVEISTDKVNAEVPSPVTGVIREIMIKEGETVPVGAALAIIDEVGAATGAPVAAPTTASAPKEASATPNGASATHSTSRNGEALNAPDVLRRVSPAVRRLAREHHVELSSVRGTGAGGRITASDVLAAAREGPAANVAATIMKAPTAPLPAGTSTYGAAVPGTTIKLSQARKIIAQRMLESKHTAPHAWTMVEVDVTNVWKWRAAEKDRFQREKGQPLTLLPFFVYAVVQSLKAFPLMNSRFTDEGIAVLKELNIGLAVALDSNLMVPVIRDADNYSIGGLAVAAGKIIERARAGKLTADDLSGGTFTVNNTGANGSLLSAPILNGGQAGIVTMEAVVKRPVVVDNDAIAIRSIMNVCLSLDHRVVDGAIASAFLVDLKKRFQAMGPGDTL